ncbi:hypothetical protein GCM10022215_02000 [Nocardioides fonticola]|uniref:Uncharacterized protein n=1 Tax=Nocardioides fonticola TaxID=450363 RepID=A0ABP7X9J9_9ACTN
MTTPRPRAVDLASGLLLGLLGLGAVTVVLTIVQRDDLILNWAQGHREAREIVARQGLAYLKAEQPIAIPQFVPVAWVLWVVIVSLVLVLLALFRHGHAWARWVLATLVVLIGIATGAAIRIGAPTSFEVLAWGSLLLDVAILATLFRPTIGRFVHAPA